MSDKPKQKQKPKPPPAHPTGAQRCQARAKSTGQQCRLWAVRGMSVCRIHGGKAPSGPGAGGPTTHGLYSKFRKRLDTEDLRREALALDLAPEIEFMRSLLDQLDQELEGGLAAMTVDSLELMCKVTANIRGLIEVMRRPSEPQVLEVRLADTGLLRAIYQALEDYGGPKLSAEIARRAADILREHPALDGRAE